MDTAVAVIAVVAAVSVFAIIGRFASAYARRLERRPTDATRPDAAIEELRQELDGVHERLDFIERVLLAQKEHGGRALPGETARPESKATSRDR